MASIHTFADYLNATYYNEIFKEVDEYVQEYPGKMGGDSGIDYPDEASVLDVHVRSTGVDDAPGDGISFLAVVEADLEVVSISHHYRDSQGSSMWFKVQCTATLHNGLQNFSVQDVSIYSEYDRKRHDVLSDTLVPIIYSVELEKIATDFVRRYYPEALLTPMPIIPEELARRMGLHIEEVHLSKTCTVFGMTCFKKGIVEVYDQELKRYKDIKVEENTILVDPDIYFMRSLGCKNNTVVHECVHWDKHKKFFELQKLFNPEAAAIRCQVSETNKRKDKDRTDYEWMEWQASALAPRILMPEAMTRQKVNELIEKNQNLLHGEEKRNLYESVIYELKEFFGVSTQAAKIRLIDLGYDAARGVLSYVDDHYISNYSFENGALKKDQTYHISVIDAMIQSKMNPTFAELISSGKFLYVDSHFCINDTKYLKPSADGSVELTEYAMMHIDECCLAFSVKRSANPYYETRYYKECVLFRDALVETLEEVSYMELPQNATVIERAERLEKESKAAADIIATLPGTFNKAFEKLMDLYDVTEAQLSEAAKVDEKTISRIRTKVGYRTKYKTLIQLCLGLHLHPLISEHLLKLSAIQPITGFYEDIAYSLILKTGWRKSIREINEELASTGTVKPFYQETEE